MKHGRGTFANKAIEQKGETVMKSKRQTMAWRLAAGVLAAAVAWGCGGRGGDEAARTPMDEGMSAEALGDRATAMAKYEEARREGDRQGSRKVAELAMRRFEEDLFPAEPKDEGWVSSARELYVRLESAGREAQDAGFPVEGFAAALETYKERIDAEEETVRKDAAVREAEEHLAALKEERTRLEEDIRNDQRKLDQYEEEGAAALGEILAEVESQKDEMENRTMALALAGVADRGGLEWIELEMKRAEEIAAQYEAMMDPLNASIQEKRERLEAVEAEIRTCTRQLAGAGGETAPSDSPQEPPPPRKLTAEEREAMWEGW